MPPDIIRVDFTWSVDSHMNRMHWGWVVMEGAEEQVVEMEARPFRYADTGLSQVMIDHRNLLGRQLGRVVPFP